MPPKISVCIPTYNYAMYLSEAIESIQMQNIKDYELIVIDDSSTDNTVEIVKRYADHDNKIKFFVNSNNVGMVANWNLCLNKSSGEYIKFVFGDDFLLEQNALEKMINLMDSDDSVALVCSSRLFIDCEANKARKRGNFVGDVIIGGVDVINKCLFSQKNLIGEPTAVMFRRSLAGRGFDDRYKQMVDLEMWFHLLEQGKLAYIDEPLCAFRVHANQQTAQNRENMVSVDDLYSLYYDYMNKPYVNISDFARFFIFYENAYIVFSKCYTGFLNKFIFFAFYPFYLIIRPIYRKFKKYVIKHMCLL